MKIGFTGTGASGKTSVAKPLAEQLGIPYRESVVRGAFQKTFPEATDANQHLLSPQQSLALQGTIFNDGVRQLEKFREGVFDRTMTCYLAYSIYQCADVISDRLMLGMMDIAKKAMSEFDLVVFFPLPSWEPAYDPFRRSNYAYRLAIDTLILGLLKNLGIEYIVAPDTDPEGRVLDVLKHLDLGKELTG